MKKQVLSNYYKNLQGLLTDYSDFSGIAKESTESGKNREVLVASVLKQHLPSRASVIQGGIVIDGKNETSGQVDVVICNSFSFLGGALEYGLIPVEAVIAAIEVKSAIHSSTLKKAFYQLDRVKRLQKEIIRSNYDGSEDITPRTRRALTVGWFWKKELEIETACEYLLDPKKIYDEGRDYQGNRPNAIYVHNNYLLISDPCPNKKSGKGTGNPNPFLEDFRNKDNVLRGMQYSGNRGKRDIYHFDSSNWNPLEVLLMWLSNEVNRYVWEIPNFNAYVHM